MLQSNEKIIKHKVGLLNLAEELGNVSKACQIMGLSRDPPSGCHFHPRCPFAMDICRSEAPRLEEIAPGRFSACYLNHKT